MRIDWRTAFRRQQDGVVLEGDDMRAPPQSYSHRRRNENRRWIRILLGALAMVAAMLFLFLPLRLGRDQRGSHAEGRLRTNLKMLRDAVLTYQDKYNTLPDSLESLTRALLAAEVIEAPRAYPCLSHR